MSVQTILEATEFTLPGLLSDGGLDIIAARYRPPQPAVPGRTTSTNESKLSLVFAHGVSFHKETFLPTIEHLFELQTKADGSDFSIVEAWVVDSPNHGQAAIRNDARLIARPQGITGHEWGRAVQVLLKSGLIQGASVVGIGHSAGTCILTLSTVGYAIDKLPYSSFILIEPSMIPRDILGRGMSWDALITMANTRKDIWPSRAAAREWMASRLPWKLWTPRCIDLYVEYALRDLPTATYPNKHIGVTLCCTRVQDAAGYMYYEDGIDGLNRLKELCSVVPVHCIFGKKHDIVPAPMKASIVDPGQGRRMTTISEVPGAGHLVVMEEPRGLALAIWEALRYSPPQKSKL